MLNELKNRGVKDILVLCADGITGIKEAISAAFPKTEYQRCIVHMVRNRLKLERVATKWTPKYLNSMKRWKDNWDCISPIFKFSSTVRKVIIQLMLSKA